MSESILPREELLAKIPEFTLMDDTYMTVFFKDQPELIEFVLRIILNRDDLTVKEAHVQESFKNLHGHSSALDIYAVDSNNTEYDIEIQSRSDGARPERARYYSSLIDSNVLMPDEEYERLPETYVIFFTGSDYFKKDLPVYTIDRYIAELGYTPFNDREHILYINGSNKADTPLGRLARDFKCKKPSEMHYKPLAERAHDLKDTEGGNEKMCQIMEDLNAKAAAKAAAKAEKRMSLQIASKMLNTGKLSIEEIAKCSELTIDEVESLAKENKALKS